MAPGHVRTAVRLCSPIPRAAGALHGVSPPPTHGGLRPGNGARSAARTLRIFFWTVRLRRIDHTGVMEPVNAMPRPYGRAAYDGTHFWPVTLSLDQTATKKKFSGNNPNKP